MSQWDKETKQAILESFGSWEYPRPSDSDFLAVKDYTDETVEYVGVLVSQRLTWRDCIANGHMGDLVPCYLSRGAWLHFFPAVLYLTYIWETLGLPPLSDTSFERVCADEVAVLFDEAQLHCVVNRVEYLMFDPECMSVNSKAVAYAWIPYWSHFQE